LPVSFFAAGFFTAAGSGSLTGAAAGCFFFVFTGSAAGASLAFASLAFAGSGAVCVFSRVAFVFRGCLTFSEFVTLPRPLLPDQIRWRRDIGNP
jgi:hypothetical protein